MRTWMIGFLIGCTLVAHFSVLHSYLFLSLCLFTSCLVTYFFSQKITWMIVAIFLGMSWTTLQANWRLHHVLPHAMEGKTLTLTGTITSIPEQTPTGFKFIFHTQGMRLAMTWRQHHAGTPLMVGDVWQLTVRVKQAHGFMNPGSFDYEGWMFQNNYQGSGYVISTEKNHLLESFLFSYPLARIREHLADKMQKTLSASQTSGTIKALILGIRSDVSPTQWQIFRDTGTIHLMIIAGLHIGLGAGFIYRVINFLWRRSRRLSLVIASPKAAAIAALLFAGVYCCLAGFSIPTERAFIMLSVFMLGMLWQKVIPIYSAICLALGIILLIDPFAPMDPGFWMSFIAVAVITYSMSLRLYAVNIYWRWGRMQWAIMLGLIPLTLIYFQQASLISIVANFIAIPWVGFLVVPLSLIGTLCLFISSSLGGLFLKSAAWLMSLLLPILANLAKEPHFVWHTVIANIWILILVMLGILILLAPRGIPGRWLGIFGFIPILCFHPLQPSLGHIWLTVLDVGQGLSAVIQTKTHVLIFDTGPKFSANFDTGGAVLVPYLRLQGIHHINLLMISHGDNDHIGGADSLISQIPVSKVSTSVPERFSHSRVAQVVNCQQGQSWEWDGVHFEVLYPYPHINAKSNDRSCVLKVTVGKEQLILPGDIEKSAELYLLAHEKSKLFATILVAPHHGSLTSSTPAFIAAVKPTYVIYATGYRNRYRLPNATIVQRYQNSGAKAFNSVDNGAVKFEITPTGINKISLYRDESRRYWNS